MTTMTATLPMLLAVTPAPHEPKAAGAAVPQPVAALPVDTFASAPREVMSCDGGAATMTRRNFGTNSMYTFHVNPPQSEHSPIPANAEASKIVDYFKSVLSPEAVLQGLDPNRHLVNGNRAGAFSNRDEYVLPSNTVFPTAEPNLASGGPTILNEGFSSVIVAGRGVRDEDIGKVVVTPGVYARPEGAGWKVSFFRNQDEANKVPGLYLGDWFFQNCKLPQP